MSELLYLLTSLPSLPDIGEKPPMSLHAFAELVSETPTARQVVDAIFLERDLLMRQSILVGEIKSAEPLVLTEKQISGQDDLPLFLQPEGKSGRDDDSIWGSYYMYVHELGRSLSCEFLQAWAGFEVALRNTISHERVKKLHLAPEEYLVAESIAIHSDMVDAALDRWATAKDPHSAALELDLVCWEMLTQLGAWFSFSIDEIAAYARGLLMLHRWKKLGEGSTEESRGLLSYAMSTSP
ncbi:MAG: hypothetical protein ABIJ57_12400 [Pseudomonadota bacterium]